MRIRNVVTSLALAVGIAALTASAAGAVGTIDQSMTGTGSYTYYYTVRSVQADAQTFTAGISGLLDRVTFDVRKDGNPGDLNVAIFATANGVPSGPQLAAQTVLAANIPASHSTITLDLSAPVAVVAGTTYTLILSAPGATTLGNQYLWYMDPDQLANGTAWVRNSGTWIQNTGYDMLFATYVTAPSTPTPTQSSTPTPTQVQGSSQASVSPTSAATADSAALASTGVDMTPIALFAVGAVVVGALAVGRRRSARTSARAEKARS